MKKVLTALAIVAAFGITSCGGPDLCDCVNLRDERKAEIKEAGDDKYKVKEIKEEYEAKREECDKLIEEMAEDKGKDEVKKAIKECK